MQRIPLKVSESYFNNNATQDTTFLIDDNPNTLYHPNYPAWHYSLISPARTTFLLDDYDPCVVKEFRYYTDNANQWNVRFYLVIRDTKEEVLFFTWTGGGPANTEQSLPIPLDLQVPVSKLIIEVDDAGPFYPNYIQLWGDYVEHPDPVFNRQRVQIKDLLGVVVHPWDIDYLYPYFGADVNVANKLTAILGLQPSAIRLYDDASLVKDVNGVMTLNGGWQQCDAMRTLTSNGIKCHVCYQGQSLDIAQAWQAAGINSQLNFPYQYNNNTDRAKVSSYQNVGKDCYVFGRDNATSNPKYLYTLELGNENNAWWGGYATFMNGSQLAPFLSMGYDGHKGTYPNQGVKTADPSVLFSSTGLASDRTDIIHEIRVWSKENRGLKANSNVDLPMDVYSFHCYSSLGGQYSGTPGGIPPEYGMIPQIRQIVYWSNKYGNGIPVWIGEWGWDVHPDSVLNAPAYGSYTAEQTRAYWFVRGILSFAEEGVDKAEWYRLYQDYYNQDPRGGNVHEDNNPTQFATMALLRQLNNQNDVIRLLVGDFFKQMNEFGNFKFVQRINSSPTVLQFSGGTQMMYVIWDVEDMDVPGNNVRPVFTERTGTYNLPVSGTMKIFSENLSGSTISIPFTGGSINYSAKPVFVITNNTAGITPTPTPSVSVSPVPSTPTPTSTITPSATPNMQVTPSGTYNGTTTTTGRVWQINLSNEWVVSSKFTGGWNNLGASTTMVQTMSGATYTGITTTNQSYSGVTLTNLTVWDSIRNASLPSVANSGVFPDYVLGYGWSFTDGNLMMLSGFDDSKVYGVYLHGNGNAWENANQSFTMNGDTTSKIFVNGNYGSKSAYPDTYSDPALQSIPHVKSINGNLIIRGNYLGNNGSGNYGFLNAIVIKEYNVTSFTTPTPTPTVTSTPTQTPTQSSTPTQTPTASITSSKTPTPTATPNTTATSTPTVTKTATSTASQTPTQTVTSTTTKTPTQTRTLTGTPTPTATNTPSVTHSRTPAQTKSPSASPTKTPVNSPTVSVSGTPPPTPTNTPSHTPIKKKKKSLGFISTATEALLNFWKSLHIKL
jgi:hypothetical protein